MFKSGDRVKLRTEVARDLQAKYGKHNHMFANLVGVVGILAPHGFEIQGSPTWFFIAPRKKFVIGESEIEAIVILGGDES